MQGKKKSEKKSGGVGVIDGDGVHGGVGILRVIVGDLGKI